MERNQTNLNQQGIDEFPCELQSLGPINEKISNKPLKIKYSNMPPNSTYLHHSTTTKYKNQKEYDNEKEVRSPSHTHRFNEL